MLRFFSWEVLYDKLFSSNFYLKNEEDENETKVKCLVFNM